MHRTRNAAYSQGYREFESPPLRQLQNPDFLYPARRGLKSPVLAGFWADAVDLGGPIEPQFLPKFVLYGPFSPKAVDFAEKVRNFDFVRNQLVAEHNAADLFALYIGAGRSLIRSYVRP